MKFYINLGIFIFAALSAIFWFWAAAVDHPKPQIAWGGSTLDDDPFYLSLKHSNRLSKLAALFSGLSALCTAITYVF